MARKACVVDLQTPSTSHAVFHVLRKRPQTKCLGKGSDNLAFEIPGWRCGCRSAVCGGDGEALETHARPAFQDGVQAVPSLEPSWSR